MQRPADNAITPSVLVVSTLSAMAETRLAAKPRLGWLDHRIQR